MLVTMGAVRLHTTSGVAARTRRRVWAAGGSGLGAAVAVACGVGDGASGGAAGGDAPSLKTGVTLRMMQYGTQPEVITKQEVLRQFEAEHPGLKAELDNGSAGYADKLAAATAGGEPPDVFWFDPALFLEYARRGFLLDLAPLIRRDKYDLTDFFERALAQYEWQGKRYGMPKDFPARGMYFNQNAFQDNGIAPPAVTYADNGWTWDRFLDAAQKLTRERNGAANYGWTMGTGFREWMVWVYANGGEFVDKDATECLLHEPAAVDALQLLQDVRTKYRCMPPPADVQAGATFALGRVAMIESGPFNIGNLRRDAKDFTWDAGPMPRGRNGRYAATGGGAGQGIAPGSKHPEEAWALLKHVMSPDSIMTEIVREHLNMPGRKSLANSKEYLGSGLPPKNIKAFVDGLNALRVDPQTTNWGEINAATVREIAPLWPGEKSARDVAFSIKRAVDTLLAQAEAKRRL
jgi:multiple sugar transport system substrate-binding protein